MYHSFLWPCKHHKDWLPQLSSKSFPLLSGKWPQPSNELPLPPSWFKANQIWHQCKWWYYPTCHVHSFFYLYLMLSSSPSPTYPAPPLSLFQSYHQCWAYPDDHSLACDQHQPPLPMEHDTLHCQLSHCHCHQKMNSYRNCHRHPHCCLCLLRQHSPHLCQTHCPHCRQLYHFWRPLCPCLCFPYHTSLLHCHNV